ncbi:putative 3-ketoacyl-CoA protein [Thermochaetoides thermophila DSM 1495]|uniref:Very-long-chain 3-oxoacyl-CoA reductase n=1 Tax=Chaetomium thermophilum (strain DSM 1495 / CBS 144.50 / IMI 039719) TaxID=759272 RepID=G0S7B5_CHATD|nr:putative 3-ketoacyl-CoA protein [Thermochaetoides thermophila DSM 1495]EGS21759.1 putative 3-ketoacyl-CoA protein [Thermochaetoides thermophila DSM 1495]
MEVVQELAQKTLQFWNTVPQGAQWALAGVGALYVVRNVLSFVQLILSCFILSGTNLRKYGKKGTWAIVTGASDGLGKEFAQQLAAKGFNLVLVSRTQSKLDALARELTLRWAGLQVKTLSMDYTQDNDADYERLAKLIDGLDVGILINNVGQSHSIPVPFLETARDEMQNIITVNCLGTLKTTKVVAPFLVKRRNGLILTLGSFAGVMPTPYLATYSGSKAFLQHWSASLASELQPYGVDVQFIVAYLITTAMSKVRRTSLLIPNPKQFVRSALGKIGLDSIEMFPNTYTPWWSHSIFKWIVATTVGTTSRFTIWYNRKMHIDIRNRALRKAAREAKKQD